MTKLSVLDRVKNAVYPVITRNALLDALLGGPSDEISVAEAKVEAWSYGADDVDDATTVAVTAGSAIVTLTGGLTTLFQTNDDFVIAGSIQGNSGRYIVTNVNNSTQLTLNKTFTVAESGLFYARTKPRLVRVAKGYLLFPGGYEPDATIRSSVLGAMVTTHQMRGSSSGITTEFNRITNSANQLMDTVKPLTSLGTGIATTSLGAAVTITTSLVTGDDFTIAGSTKGSNGRYFVYSNSGTAIIPARRAVSSTQYYAELSGGAEVQIREDRANSKIYFRLINVTGQASNRVNLSIAVTGATVTASGTSGLESGVSESLTAASGSVSTSGNGDSTWRAAPGQIKEGWAQVSSLSAAEFTVTWSQTVGTIRAVRLGRAGLAIRTASGAIQTGALNKFRFGGLILTATRSGIAETALTVYADGYPSYYLGFSNPGTYENDAYTIITPVDFVVLDLDHRNYGNYSETDLKNIARDYLIPVDTEYVIGFV